jgi:hypothetical protein
MANSDIKFQFYPRVEGRATHATSFLCPCHARHSGVYSAIRNASPSSAPKDIKSAGFGSLASSILIALAIRNNSHISDFFRDESRYAANVWTDVPAGVPSPSATAVPSCGD